MLCKAALPRFEGEHSKAARLFFLGKLTPRKFPNVVRLFLPEFCGFINDRTEAIQKRSTINFFARCFPEVSGKRCDNLERLICVHWSRRSNTHSISSVNHLIHQKLTAVLFFTSTTANVTLVNPPVVAVAIRTYCRTVAVPPTAIRCACTPLVTAVKAPLVTSENALLLALSWSLIVTSVPENAVT